MRRNDEQKGPLKRDTKGQKAQDKMLIINHHGDANFNNKEISYTIETGL